ncbi:O-succinylhomoserine sulfhydrylase [Beggiatoa alba B18LD]|uniref:O-succinylhomoserine sulfhydrylase n=2 Tax=Beggiatoa alba B18LD TaxID=395493 RepID=I3CF37_9GAMM|nr:O-succinylhomoserine sulfhydrylase [Beggiatoa alba]EIJ42230.1 O-succinylhomoserine sulfhydrylase [Beggiatoa alba B18LD]
MIDDWSEFGLETRAIRAGQTRTEEGEHSEALFLTSSFVFNSAAEAAARFSGKTEGNVYSRFTNPTVRMFEKRLAALEGGERCIATSSGMAAILTTCLGLLKTGDQILASQSIFGSSVTLFDKILSRFGIQTKFIELNDYQVWENAFTPQTRLCFLETPSNPLTEIVDLRKMADLAHAHNALLVVDNCFCSPALQQPLKWGADIVIHSATKFLDGQGRCIGGAIVGSEALLGGDVYGVLRSGGTSLSPFNAWVFLKGLETLNLRMKAHSANGLALAQWLEAQPQVKKVYYPGLPSHPQHELAKRQQSAFGGLVSFEVHGGREVAWRVIDNTRLISITANLGDTKTTITHPASTTHGRISPEQREAANITEGLLRISVGLEEVTDIQADLARGLCQ